MKSQVRNIRFGYRRLWAAWCWLCLTAGAALYAQPVQEAVPVPGLRPVQELSDWRADGAPVAWPVCPNGTSQVIEHALDWQPEYGSVTPVLVFERLAWRAGISVNEVFITVSEDPFVPVVVPIQQEWLKPSGNVIRIRLSKEGAAIPGGPEPFAGAWGRAYLAVPGEAPALQAIPLETHVERALILPPFGGEGPCGDSVMWARALKEARSAGISALFFPYEPDFAQRKAVLDARFVRIASLQHADSVALYRDWPNSARTYYMGAGPWVDDAGSHLDDYGRFFKPGNREAQQLPADLTGFILLVVLPFLGLALLKVADNKVYASIFEFVTKPKLFWDQIAAAKFFKQGQLVFMNLMHLSIMAATVTIFVEYLVLNGREQELNVVSGSSLLAGWAEFDGLGTMFLYVLFYITLIQLGKYLFLNFIGQIYRRFGFGSVVANMDVLASMPQVFILPLPAIALFFTSGSITEITEIFFLIWAGAFFLWRWRTIWMGLTVLFSFPASLKILYICALEVLPWVFLV